MASFNVGNRVVLEGLAKAPQYNGKTGIVRSTLNQEGRYHVYVEDLDKTMALRPANLKYEPRSLDSLSVKELKTILKGMDKSVSEFAGMDKSDLRDVVSKTYTDSNQIGEVLAKSSSSAPLPAAAAPAISKQDLQSQADQMMNMNPDQLRQQAQMMRSMDPATLRRMNPQMAGLSDEQIKMAANQMEMMASNPSMMKMAAEQMKNMSPEEIEQQRQAVMGGGGNQSSNFESEMYGKSAAKPKSTGANPNQAQNLAQQMGNMSPEQLKQQAEMMRNMDSDTVRRMNPQLANMTDDQIKAAISQMDAIASNPEMLKMATEQMKNMSPEDLAAMQDGKMPAGGMGSPGSVPANMDPSQMLKNMDPKQLKSMLDTVKKNPEMLKQLMESNPAMANMSEDQMAKGIEAFADMDEKQLERVLNTMQSVQKVTQPFTSAYSKVNGAVGGHLGKILGLLFGMLLISFFARFFGASSGDTTGLDDLASLNVDTGRAAVDEIESEF